jgi:cell division protein FtsX
VTWADAVRLALASVSRRFGRTALTVIAVALASALLVALGTIVVTANSRVINQVSKGGPITAIRVAAARAQPGQLATDDFRLGEPLSIDDEIVQAIEGLPHVTSVSPVLDLDAYAVPPLGVPDPDPFFDRIVGVDLRHLEELPITVLVGRLPSPGLSTEAAVTLGYLDHVGMNADDPASAIGQTVEIGNAQVIRGPDGAPVFRGRWLAARIVGVVAQEAAPGSFLLPIEQVEAARSWALAGIAARGQPLPSSQYSALVVVASTLSAVHDARQEINVLGYSTSAPEQLIANVGRYLRVVDIVLGAIGLIALVIASLGISNTLLAAVRERRREIGVLKAIGARDRDVMRVFLLEAACVGLLGGAIGTAVGIGVAAGVGVVVNRYLQDQGLEGVQLVVPFIVVLAGVGGATLLALIAGTLPARRAARLPARDAVGGA